MHIILDRYAGAGTSMTALVPRTRDNFVPELRRCTGFQGYAAIASDQGDIIACALWDSADAAAEADPHVRTWLGSNLPELEHYTKRFSGDVDYHAVAGGSVADGSQSAHFSLSRSDNNLKTPLLQDTTVLMGQAVQNTPGFCGAYFSGSSENLDHTAYVLLFDSAEHVQAAHQITVAIMREHHPHVNIRAVASGKTAVLAIG